MIDGILGLFKREDWRGQPRKNEPFHMAWLVADHVQKPAKGLEISHKDIVFMMSEHPPGKNFNVLIHIRNRYIPLRVEVVHEESVNEGGQVFYRFGCKYVGLKADDWDAIVRYVSDEPEPEDKAQSELAQIRQKADDAYRLIPLAVQNKLIELLVRDNKLEAPAEGRAPALRMTYLGASKKADGSKVHHVSIHSRKQINDEWVGFDTRFRIDAAGKIERS